MADQRYKPNPQQQNKMAMSENNKHRVNYFRFLTEKSKFRRPDAIEEYKHMQDGGDGNQLPAVSMVQGIPATVNLPISHASFTLQDGTPIYLDQSQMAVAQTETSSYGYPPMVKFLEELQMTYHQPPQAAKGKEGNNLQIAMTTGSQAGLGKAFEMLLKPGDFVLVERPTNHRALTALRALNARIIEVETDKFGIIPESLMYQMGRWHPAAAHSQHSDVARVLYTMPTAADPTGATITEQRKLEIYEICRKYNMLILEDDPNYFLQFSSVLTPSYLSLDVDGRVLRFDSFENTMGPGYRLGWVTGHTTLVDKIVHHIQAAEQSPSAISQLVLYQILNTWGVSGYKAHTERVAELHKQKRDCMLLAADKYLRGMAEWSEPSGGMYLWIRINNIKDSRETIKDKGLKNNVLVVPGSVFLAFSDEQCAFVRASFSNLTPQEIDQGIMFLSNLIKQETGYGLSNNQVNNFMGRAMKMEKF
ncbi:unnamed protein product [Owenia fusiformis]|uniref:Aminotransferase class I/classII large domain-containing protein n=1 Tax=Owenia fusiformis TaxID=6347 RepID=A0A8J1TFC6_OWEFU|nr:unnamed protein product [Owenia fusiformis]